MTKSSVAVRTPARRSSTRAAASKSAGKPSRRKAAQPTTNSRAVRATIPTPHNQPLTDAELEVIWKTYKRTRDENLRNTLIEHHMPLVRTIAERVLQTLPKSIDVDGVDPHPNTDGWLTSLEKLSHCLGLSTAGNVVWLTRHRPVGCVYCVLHFLKIYLCV